MKQATRSACKPCGKLSLDLFMRDAFAAVELIHSFLDCREKFNPLGDFTQRNLVGQLANGIQYNFFLRHVVNMPGRQVKANWKGVRGGSPSGSDASYCKANSQQNFVPFVAFCLNCGRARNSE